MAGWEGGTGQKEVHLQKAIGKKRENGNLQTRWQAASDEKETAEGHELELAVKIRWKPY